MASLSLTLVEIIVLMLGAITLGITIHFFITSRRSLSTTVTEASTKLAKELEDWKLRYFNDVEVRDKELTQLKEKLADTEENNDINSIEADEMRQLNKKLKAEIESLRNTFQSSTEADELRLINKKLNTEIESLRNITPSSTEAEELRLMNSKLKAEIDLLRTASPSLPATEKTGGYIEQLRLAQNSLLEHNEKINKLLGQIDIVKETEEKQQEIQRVNEELSSQIDDLKFMLSQKEKEISNTRQKEHLTSEMTSMLDSAYNEFNALQDKIHKLEGQVNNSKLVSLDYEDLKEAHQKVVRDFDAQKVKYNAAITENQQLQAAFDETQDKLKEANFQRQQLQKRVVYLEELNNDMQAVSEANKKLESQLKRVGELESMLNVIAEERDELARKQTRTS